jgi:hypothetical protein
MAKHFKPKLFVSQITTGAPIAPELVGTFERLGDCYSCGQLFQHNANEAELNVVYYAETEPGKFKYFKVI